mgnify:FL=1
MKQFIRDTENFNKFENQLGQESNSIHKVRRVRNLKTKQERVQKDLSLPNQKQTKKKGFK